MDAAIYDFRAQVLKAMAHPARLQIIDALAEGEKCVCELQELIGSALPTVSRHLTRMKSAGIIAGRRDGNSIYYRLLMPCVLRIFGCIDEVVSAEADRKAAACSLADHIAE